MNRKGKNNSNYKHGMSNTRQYGIWMAMKKRCCSKSNIGYYNYGGRGITYDPKWDKFEGFWEDMGDDYKDNLTIDRIDSNKNYCKDNCRWITQHEQTRNTRSNNKITINGETKILTDWAKHYGISRDIIYYRINKLKLSPMEAVTKPINKNKQKASYSRNIFDVEHLEMCKEENN